MSKYWSSDVGRQMSYKSKAFKIDRSVAFFAFKFFPKNCSIAATETLVQVSLNKEEMATVLLLKNIHDTH